MRALQDVINASPYQADGVDSSFGTSKTSTALQPASSSELIQNFDTSYTASGSGLSTSFGIKAYPSAPSGSTSGSTVTPGSVSGVIPCRVGTSTPSSGGGDSPEGGSSKIRKRRRNTEAARRYRQRKLDRVSELEEALEDMAKERDELKLKLAKAEAEAGVLRGLVGK
ncbi:hypothetical protein DOTSEDRAFT_20214 [Dothistroma septosporum NZE10]|uniref:BZIP domain-containing protein n=1 Tax=Dothistroma septosporum (strain NZE10 / CBS 128990) TaxID=675120 RepID=N1Q4N2_DOTSN|nr:hypothetical protein DOTSEDRAFT_20214 [Dothistroma septosporum NZE10]